MRRNGEQEAVRGGALRERDQAASAVSMTPCQGRSHLFDDPTRVDEARAVCKRECARLIECRFFALHNDVAGVCGGLTETERALWRAAFGIALPVVETVEEADRRLRDLVVLNHLKGGASAAEVGHQVGLTPRSIDRVKRAHGFIPEEYPAAWRCNGLLAANLTRVSA